MPASLVMTILGPDRPGLVRLLSDIVVSNGGNWLESRMARLAGQFAGIARVECSDANAAKLIAELDALKSEGIAVQAVRETIVESTPRRTISVDVVGNDRPGIVRELAAAIANAGGNVEELTTGLESAPMSGHPIFRAKGVISIPENSDTATLIEAIETLGGDLSVDIA
ncbi:MAG TPA: ACT domain-containing protein [Luteolibacter sp.]|nr:ACT domain-containing protein [Luteolibacter sp.]